MKLVFNARFALLAASGQLLASLIFVDPEVGGTMFLRNAGELSPDYFFIVIAV
jgi:hypothetical protein